MGYRFYKMGKNLRPAEGSSGIDSEFLAKRIMKEAQQTDLGKAFIMNPLAGERHKATAVTDWQGSGRRSRSGNFGNGRGINPHRGMPASAAF